MRPNMGQPPNAHNSELSRDPRIRARAAAGGFFLPDRAVMARIMNGLTAAQALQIKRERDDSDDSKWGSIADIFELGNVKLISLSLESDSRKSWEAYQIRESVNLNNACFIQKKVEKLKISLAKDMFAPVAVVETHGPVTKTVIIGSSFLTST